MEQTKSPIRGIGVLASAKACGQVLSWASTVLIMRELDPSAYGLVAICAVYIGFATIIAEFGLTQSLLRSDRTDPCIAQQVLGLSLIISTIAFSLIIIIASIISIKTSKFEILNIVVIQSLTFLINSASLRPTSELQREARVATIGAIEIIIIVVSAATSLTFAKCGLGLYSIVLGPMAGSIVKILILRNYTSFSLIPKRPSIELVREKFNFAKKSVPTALLYQAENNVDLVIGSYRFNSFELGLYSTAAYWANMPFGRIMNTFNQVLLPHYISKNKVETKANINNFLAGQVILMLYISCAFFLGLGFLRP